MAEREKEIVDVLGKNWSKNCGNGEAGINVARAKIAATVAA